MTEIPGYVISWRSKWDHPIFRRKQEAAVWAWMCDTAQWQDYRMPTKFGPIDLKRGELVIAEREVAEDFGLHRNTLRSLIQRMVDDGMITLIRDRIPHRIGTVVSIVKYEQYQQFGARQAEGQDRKPTEARTEAGPKEDRSGTKNNKDNTYNEDKEDSPPTPQGESEPGLFEDLAPVAVPDKPRKAKVPPLFTTAQIDGFFAEFMAAYPDRDKPHGVKGAKRIFIAALKRKVDPAAIISAATRYCQEAKTERKFGTAYVMDAYNWLNRAKWEDYSGVHPFPVTEPEWKTNPRAYHDRNHPPVWDDAPVGKVVGLWVKGSKSWTRRAS